jgi:tRNA dimethylallyltransferase
MNNPITLIVGPTATGKSTWALNEAVKNKGEILNADSVQIYKYLDIGSAKPSREEQGRVPHHLFDLVEPSQLFTAGDYRREALKIIEERLAEAPLYIVGGSGFYIQALEKGMYPVQPISSSIKAEVDEIVKNGELFSKIQSVDPKTAQKNGPNDHYRNRRALEVSLSEGRPFSQIESDFAAAKNSLGDRFTLKKIGLNLDRVVLRERVAKRVQMMLENGLLDEVQALIDRGFSDTRALSSVGYRECVDHLAGRLKYDELAPLIVTSTMQLAKRQANWFKRDREISWISSANLD